MDFGLMTEPQLGMTYDRQLDLARWTERAGLAVFARSDHYAFPRSGNPHATDAFATLAGLARETVDIELCVLVSPITFRHPAVVAKMAATIDEMSGGRLRLGVGTGWMEAEHEAFGMPFPDWSERFARLEESLGYLWAALGRSGPGFSGAHYRLAGDIDVRPKSPGLAIIVGGTGPEKTPRLAGTYADEYNMAFLPVDQIAIRVERARAAAEEAGRDPNALLVSVMGHAVVGATDASFRANLERVAAAAPFGRSADEIAAGLRDRGGPVGTREEAADAMGRLADAGVERFYLQALGPYDHGFLEEQFAVIRGA